MLDWFDMIGNHNERVIKNDKTENFILDTCIVTDRPWIYETAVCHKYYNNGQWIILAGTYTKEGAMSVHDKWLETLLKNDKLKDYNIELKDIFSSMVFKKEDY